jgi:hypothetical protein
VETYNTTDLIEILQELRQLELEQQASGEYNNDNDVNTTVEQAQGTPNHPVDQPQQ